jgi:hypothetical protein
MCLEIVPALILSSVRCNQSAKTAHPQEALRPNRARRLTVLRRGSLGLMTNHLTGQQ